MAQRRSPRTRKSPLLEREVELAAARDAVRAAAEGEGCLVVIEGPAGIGKTRLLKEVVASARLAGVRTMTARGGELEGRFAFGVVRQLFEPLLTAVETDVRDELLSGAATHARRLFDAAATDPPLGDEEPSFALLHGLYWLTANASSAQPCLLAVDDLHWVDAPSLRWLDYLARRLDGLPVLVVCATRAPEQQSAEPKLVADLISQPGVSAIRPGPLRSASIAELARTRHGLETDAAFGSALEQATGGNPLFIHAVLDTVAREKIPPTAEEAAKVLALGGQSIARAVAARLQRLSDDELTLARAAAVLGVGTPLRLVAALGGAEPQPAARAAAALVRADLFRQDDPVEFAHPVVRTAVYETLDAAERATAHRRAAELLSAAGSLPEAVAAHALAAPHGGGAFVVTALRTAAGRALSQGAADASAVYLTRALEEQLDAETRAEVLIELGRANRRIDGVAAIEHLREALQLLVDPTRRADIALELGRTLWFTDRHDDAAAVYERAHAELDEERERDTYEQLVTELVSSTWWEPATYPTAAARLEKLDRRVRAGGPASEVLLATIAHHEYRLGLNRERSVDLARRALASGRLSAAGSPAFSYAAYAFPIAGLFDEALAIYDTSLAQARRRGDVFHIASTFMWRGRCQTFRGDLAEAVDDLQEATKLSREHGVRVSRPLLVGFLAEALLQRGEVDEAARVVATAGFPEQLQPNLLVGFYQLLRGRIRIETGEVERGVGDILRVGEVARLVPADNPAFRPWRRFAAEGLRRLDRLDEARALAEEELALARRWGAAYAVGAALRQCGRVTEGEEGERLLREAVTTLAGSGARVEHAQALVDLGAALRRSNKRTDARAWLREGVRIAEQTGALGLAEQTNQEIAATGARPRKLLQTGADALTASERRVAGLAAEGHSNKEIAQLLFVTVKTVEVHLSSVYRKLLIESRTELGAALTATRSRPETETPDDVVIA